MRYTKFQQKMRAAFIQAIKDEGGTVTIEDYTACDNWFKVLLDRMEEEGVIERTEDRSTMTFRLKETPAE